ncbi:helix-turn-helix domain-containing protein [bacterium M00.F.Ca.ET.230.01.1.1]|nr:helix-turn-helix domain-containing protein [bacterium M00.F.Ca.ET.230.01.1.1]
MAPRKETFSPMPARAMGDKTLTGEDLRVLLALAAHDRFGANGIGCYASHPRLASLVGCHIKSLSRSLSDLAGKGYITAAPHPLNARLRVYRVVYTDDDGAYLKAGIGSKHVTNQGVKGNKPAPESGPIGNKDFEKGEQSQGHADVNILGETYKRSGETIGRYPAEAAPVGAKRALEEIADKGVGAKLAMIERRYRSSELGYNDRLRLCHQWIAWLNELVGEKASLDFDDPNYGRAYRLLEDVGSFIEENGECPF